MARCAHSGKPRSAHRVPSGLVAADRARQIRHIDPDPGGHARVHDALGNTLPVKVRDLLDELVVLQRGRASAAPVRMFWLSTTG